MTTLITGGSSGIGFAAAQRYAKAGHRLILVARDREKLERAAQKIQQEFSTEIRTIACDLTRPEDRARLIVDLEENHEMLDIVIHSAGIFVDGSCLGEGGEEAYEKQHMIHVQAIMALNRAFLVFLRKQASRIMLLGSTHGLEAYQVKHGSRGEMYSVTKWALRGYAYNLREELKEHGIGVTLVSLGTTFTEMWEGVDIPPEKFIKPEDVADMMYAATAISLQTVIEEIVLRPIQGNV